MEKPPKNNEIIEIKPMGSYFELDSEGYIINPASLDKIQEEWKPVIDEVVEVYKNLYGDKLKQVYLRGSVAKGQAVRGISDLDTWAYVDAMPEYLKEHPTNRAMREHIHEKYPFIEDIEMNGCPLSYIEEDQIMLNQAVCIYGEPLKVKKMKPGKEMVIHAPYQLRRLKNIEKFLSNESSPEKIQIKCVWFMKQTLRTGFELTMERSNRYTRDLYKCYESFSEYYPEKEPEMREVLHYALNPTTDKEIIKKIMNGIGQWFIKEVPHHFDLKE